MKSQGYIPESAPLGARERAEIDVRLVTRIAAIMIITLIILLLAVGGLFHFFVRGHTVRTSEAAPEVIASQLPPQPRIQVHPARDLQEVRALEDAHLEGYAWVDRPHGIARIPIDRAMVLWLQTNSSSSDMPSGSATNAPPDSVTELQMRQLKAQESSHAP